MSHKRDYKHNTNQQTSKRRRSRSPNKPPDLMTLTKRYKHDFNSFLQNHLNVRTVDDFWRFFEKYQSMRTVKTDTSFDKTKLLVINFDQERSQLYRKLPVNITEDLFFEFLNPVLVYQDFQHKLKFGKLKKLRTAQKELPIAQYRNVLIDMLQMKRVVLVAGDTGCGKSTQVPQYVLEAGYKKIVCTQPRRIACVSLAKRVAYETLTDFKSTIGYQIRFEKTKRSDTCVVFMTEGLLLRQTAEEETINAYDVIILDEVHERHLYGDFLIGIMKCLLQKRDDFKLILMSATINIQLFEKYFEDDDLGVVEVPGRLYPIDICYVPIVRDPYEKKRDRFDCSPYLKIIQMIDDKYQPHQKGDVLVFLNGFSEISALADAIKLYAEHKANWVVLQLHSTLSLEEQDKVFDYSPDGMRKCIISTNIAETSVTIDGIRFVIDSGKVNRMIYNNAGGINKLMETNISQDSAKQRAGRAGRTGPGICYRLYSEEDFRNFDAFTTAEIHLVPLEALMLNMISLGLSDVRNFPFLERPAAAAIEESIEKLKFCGGLKLDEEYLVLTSLGESLSKLPVDLTIGKMLIMSTVFGKVTSVLALAAVLSVQSPVTQQAYRNLDTQTERKALESNHGDPISLLNMYKTWLCVKQESSVETHHKKENSRSWAKKRGLEEQRFYEVTKLIQQFKEILEDAELLSKRPEMELSSGERSIRYGELKQLKTLRKNLKEEVKTTPRRRLKREQFDEEESVPKFDLRDVEFRIANDFKKLQELLDESSPESFKDLMMLKLILTSGLYPQVAVEDEFNYSKSVSERLYHTKSKYFVFLRPLSCFVTNPEVLELHSDDIDVPPSGYFSKRPISRKHQVLIYQSILETKKVYLVNVMRMPAMQTLMLFAKTIATNATLTKFVFDEFLMMDAPNFGQGKVLLARAVILRKKLKEKLERKLEDPSANSKVDEREMFYFMEDLVKFMTADVSYNIKRLLPADIKLIYTNDDSILPPETNPFDSEYVITRNSTYGGLQVTENVVYGCLVQEEWACVMENQVLGTPYECPVCQKSALYATVLHMMSHELGCKKVEEIVPEPVDVVIVKPNSQSYHCDKCSKTLVLSPDSAAVQMLLETCLETKEDNETPGQLFALQEVRSLVCSYLHQVFIVDTSLVKLIHFQGYPSELLHVTVQGVPSMHICLDFLLELLQQPSINKQIFAIQLLSHLSTQYALPKSLNLCVTALNLLYALLGAISAKQGIKLFEAVMPAMVHISEAFPPLVEDIVQFLVQLSRVSRSQASLASYFHDHLTWDSEICEKDSKKISELAEVTFNEIVAKTVLKTNIYN